MNTLAHTDRLITELVQIARLGILGDRERVLIQVMRLVRALRSEGNPIADVLQQAVTQAEPGSYATRSARRAAPAGITAAVPVDIDSNLDLLRIEESPLRHALVSGPHISSQLARLIEERRGAHKLKRIGLEPSKAALFTGPPGVGKTMAARHVASELGLPLVVLDLATVVSSFLGKTGNNLKQAFEFARRQKCIFFLDELDAIAKKRDDDADLGELKRLVTVILQEIDLWPSDNLLIAATNHGSLLDSAVWRRFDMILEFDRPTSEDLQALAESIKLPDDPLPNTWKDLLAIALANTSQSDFIKACDQLRRAIVIGGKLQAQELLEQIVTRRSEPLELPARKALGVRLCRELDVPQRVACKMARIARETLRSALEREEGKK